MTNTKPWHARLALWLAVMLPIFLMGCALGTKFGLWGWQTGLGGFALGGVIWMGATALLAIVSIVLCMRRVPRNGLGSAVFALLIPLAIASFFAPLVMGAGAHPIHDVATDTANPPALSPEVLAARAESDANPINDYSVPLSELEAFAEVDGPLAAKSHAAIIAETYPEVAPLTLSGTDADAAVNAVQLAMADMGLSQIRYIPETNTVEGLAETFWFGFKDDMVVRVSQGEENLTLDFRSVSRVGRSDIGANAKRIVALSEAVEQRLAE
ncbi:MAG: DUF1499 domain-containing protein [Pseudomonadota bacterium]